MRKEITGCMRKNNYWMVQVEKKFTTQGITEGNFDT